MRCWCSLWNCSSALIPSAHSCGQPSIAGRIDKSCRSPVLLILPCPQEGKDFRPMWSCSLDLWLKHYCNLPLRQSKPGSLLTDPLSWIAAKQHLITYIKWILLEQPNWEKSNRLEKGGIDVLGCMITLRGKLDREKQREIEEIERHDQSWLQQCEGDHGAWL